jgi:hypothetical protein
VLLTGEVVVVLIIQSIPKQGLNNIFDQEPPFVAGAGGDNYDQINANIKGRFWYVALKKRF